MGIAATITEPTEGLIFQGKKSVEPILRTENLWKLYRAGKVEVPALRGVNFEVLPGESVAVMGPSGCGKSSLLYVIGGLAQASRGKVLVDGNDLTELSDAARTKLRRHKIGFVFQRFNLLPTLTAKGNIAIAQFIHGDGFDPHRFDVVTQMLGLAGRLHHKPSELSGGEQQRVAIARAIINEPKLLLADEPTGNLDTASATKIADLLFELRDQTGMTLVLVTHDEAFAARCDRQIRLRDGSIVDDTLEALIAGTIVARPRI
jgi:putative ABC transport system ATP-binding protein